MTAAELQRPIDCPAYRALSDIKNFRVFQGVSGAANRHEVVDHIVLEALIISVGRLGRGVSAKELSEQLGGKVHPYSLMSNILPRLEEKDKVVMRRVVKIHPSKQRRKRWLINIYYPTMLEGKISEQEEDQESAEVA